MQTQSSNVALSARPLRVLSLTDADVFAGTEKLIYDLACSFDPNAAVATIGCPWPSPLAQMAEAASLPTLQVGAHGQPKGFSADLKTISRLKRAFQTKKFDIVHVHNGRSAFVAAIAGAGWLVPMVMSQHFLAPARTTRRGVKACLSGRIHNWLNGRIQKHVAISEAVRLACIEHGIARKEQIDVVLNGVRLPKTPASPTKWCSEPWASSVTDDNFVFCAARAEPEKDWPSLVEAMRRVNRSQNSTLCVIAGGGSQLDALRSQVAATAELKNVHLLGFRKDVADLMAACAVFVLPSIAEPFGLVIAEAMALGKPVIACDAGGPREIVVHEETGLLVPPSNPEAMSAAITRLLADRALRARMGKAARQRYERQFTAEAMARAMADVYHRVVRAA